MAAATVTAGDQDLSGSDFTFELEPFENEAQAGFRGTAGPYGEVMVFHVKPVGIHQPGSMLRAQLVSEHLPETYVDGIGMGGQPSTHKASLEIDGKAAALKYNSYGLTRAARALHITYADRKYTYTYTKSMKADMELRRREAQVAITTGTPVRGIGSRRNVTTRGIPDEIDLAIALVFEAVATDPLHPGLAGIYGILRATSNGET